MLRRDHITCNWLSEKICCVDLWFIWHVIPLSPCLPTKMCCHDNIQEKSAVIYILHFAKCQIDMAVSHLQIQPNWATELYSWCAIRLQWVEILQHGILSSRFRALPWNFYAEIMYFWCIFYCSIGDIFSKVQCTINFRWRRHAIQCEMTVIDCAYELRHLVAFYGQKNDNLKCTDLIFHN